MEKQLKLNKKITNLDELVTTLKAITSFDCTKTWNIWEVQTGTEMEKCIVVKKSATEGVRVSFLNNDTLRINAHVPNSMLNTFYQKRIGILPMLVRGMLSSKQETFLNETYDALKDNL